MKKTISVSICDNLFNLEEKGYAMLDHYLKSLGRHFALNPDKEGMMKEIELKIAAFFRGKLSAEKQVITEEEVREAILMIGTVEQFRTADRASDEPVTGNSWEEIKSKKFYRDEKRKMLGGVSAGIANNFDIDPVWIRMLFIFTTIFWGAGILVYVVLWIFFPGSDTLPDISRDKILYRDKSSGIIGGVAAGLAHLLKMDMQLLRIVFFVSLIFGGAGAFVYIAFWILTPSHQNIPHSHGV